MFNDKMIFPTTYCYLKDTICKAGNCMSKGLCEVCQYGLLRAYAARDSEHIGSLMKETEALVRANKELREELRKERQTNKELTSQLLFYKTENSTLGKGLAECCDRLWYYFGETGGTWSSNQCKNVYDTAKYYLERAKKGEDDGGKY
jgi:hypothetical protein